MSSTSSELRHQQQLHQVNACACAHARHDAAGLGGMDFAIRISSSYNMQQVSSSHKPSNYSEQQQQQQQMKRAVTNNSSISRKCTDNMYGQHYW